MNKIKTAEECLNEAVTGSANNDDWSNKQLGLSQAIDAIHSYHEQFDRWNRVVDGQKPIDDQWVHCAALINGNYEILLSAYYYSKKYNDFTAYGEAQYDRRVTHWRELPTPPKK